MTTPRFVIRLRLEHPTVNADSISEGLKCQPTLAWTRGVPRAGITRIPTSTGWQLTYELSGQRFFFQSVSRLYEWLEIEDRQPFISQFIAEGGRIDTILHLDGSSNIGDMLSPQSMGRLAKLGVGLGVEVFPCMAFDSARSLRPPWDGEPEQDGAEGIR